MLFPAVLMNFPNSKVCVIGEWSICAKQNGSCKDYCILSFNDNIALNVSESLHEIIFTWQVCFDPLCI